MADEFPSKRDAWIVAVIWAAIATLGIAAAPVLRRVEEVFWSGLLAVLLVAIAGFMLWVLYGTGYAIGSDTLLVRAGPFRWRISLAAITEVRPTRNPLSSPANSLDRLRVEHRAANGRMRAILVSPADRSRFLDTLAARCPGLARAGDRLQLRT